MQNERSSDKHFVDPNKYAIYNAKQRPELWDSLKNPLHPLNTAWQAFTDQNRTLKEYYPQLVEYEELARYQFVVTDLHNDGPASIMACARSVPFFWPEISHCLRGTRIDKNTLESLPDGGYDTILSRGVRQYLSRSRVYGESMVFTQDQEDDMPVCALRDRPNALSAISITVRPDRRRQGLAEALIATLKETAIEEGLKTLVVPLRPTRKAEFSSVPMNEYITWTNAPPTVSACVEHCCFTKSPEIKNSRHDCFDPWLRKHLFLGGKIVKIAPYSMIVDGSLAEWSQWTGEDFQQRSKEADGRPQSKRGLYVEATFPGGLVPLRIFPREGRCVYIEPNVWVYHALEND